MKLAGAVLDYYDDTRGDVFRALFPTPDSIPEVIRGAVSLSLDKQASLQDDLYALVLQQDGAYIRKYPVYDGGNTALSTAYFLKQGHLLPVEAQKIAAHNLCVAWQDYGADPPESLQKVAGVLGWAARGAAKRVAANPLGTAMGAMTLSSVVPHTAGKAWGQAKNVLSSPEVLPDLAKVGEVGGSHLMPLSASGSKRKEYINKKGSHGMHLDGHKGEEDVPPETAGRVPGEEPQMLPQSRTSPYVNTDGKEAPANVVKKTASLYALRGKYPLDSYGHVQEAVSYFGKFASRFTPEERHTYCSNVVPRASELDIEVSSDMRKYASQSFAPAHEIVAGIEMRRNLVGENYRPLLDKVASQALRTHPDVFARTLGEFDKLAGIDHHYGPELWDPFYTTFGEKRAEDEDWSDTQGNLYVSAAELKALAKTGRHKLSKVFGEQFVEDFCKDPIELYESMPMDQKKMLIRMANENAPGVEVST